MTDKMRFVIFLHLVVVITQISDLSVKLVVGETSACVRACVRVRARVCVCARARVSACVRVCVRVSPVCV